MKKILSYCLLLLFACLTFSSCDKGNHSLKNELDGTKWAGRAFDTNVAASFVGDECYITLTGYANGAGVGIYKVSAPDVFITITRLSGSSDGQLHVGDIITGRYDLTLQKMTVNIVLYGSAREIILYKTN